MSHKKNAFTLIELLVSITIGAIILTSALGVYAQFVQTKMRIEIARQMQKEVNFAIARLTDRVRNCKINSGNTASVNFDCGTNSNPTFSITTDGELKMNDELLISSKRFKIIEGENPSKFVITNEENSQPKVQLFLTVQSNKDETIKQSVRTTISSRIYNF